MDAHHNTCINEYAVSELATNLRHPCLRFAPSAIIEPLTILVIANSEQLAIFTQSQPFTSWPYGSLHRRLQGLRS